jgi:hypothetical protein
LKTGLTGSTGFAINGSKGRFLRPSAIASSGTECYYAEMSILISSLEPSILHFEPSKKASKSQNTITKTLKRSVKTVEVVQIVKSVEVVKVVKTAKTEKDYHENTKV